MSLTPEQVQGIARLARLRIADADVPGYVRNLSNILDFVAQLEKVDTTGVTPMAHPLAMAQRLRPDVVTETDQRDLIQANASAVSHGLYRVPKVIE
jgi:aspartyl-tRNA(Asn)/glutamyl-tRNA(Gln) amidotransferase subunit C